MNRQEYLRRLQCDKIGFSENLKNPESPMYRKEHLTRYFSSFMLEQTGPGAGKEKPIKQHITIEQALAWIEKNAPEKIARVKSDLEQIAAIGDNQILQELRIIFYRNNRANKI